MRRRPTNSFRLQRHNLYFFLVFCFFAPGVTTGHRSERRRCGRPMPHLQRQHVCLRRDQGERGGAGRTKVRTTPSALCNGSRPSAARDAQESFNLVFRFSRSTQFSLTSPTVLCWGAKSHNTTSNVESEGVHFSPRFQGIAVAPSTRRILPRLCRFYFVLQRAWRMLLLPEINS